MKNKAIAENTTSTISDKNLQSFPREIREAYQFIEESKDKILFPRKYIGALEVTVWEKLKASPEMTLKDILQDVLGRTPPKATAQQIMEITKMVIKNWEIHQQEMAVAS